MSKSKNQTPLKTKLLSIIIPLTIGFLLSWVIKSYILMPMEIKNDFMEPTLKKGSTAYILRMFRTKNLSIGDVVLVRSNLKDQYVLARIVGKPGDQILVQKRIVYRNGEPLDEQNFPTNKNIFFAVMPPGKSDMDEMPKTTIPEKSFFLLADNTEIGLDSRILGPIKESMIVGKLW
ncbi:signal peptidase I [Leptospira sp. 96542]|nr:signal peptidase I [Leptospira sp. 96542]